MYSSRNVTKEEQATLGQIKDTTRKAAGLSIQTPVVSASVGVASASGTGEQKENASLNQQARLTWDAHGGNTLLASKCVIFPHAKLPFLLFVSQTTLETNFGTSAPPNGLTLSRTTVSGA